MRIKKIVASVAFLFTTLTFCVDISFAKTANVWNVVGQRDFISGKQIESSALAAGPSGAVYLAYIENKQLTVMKYDVPSAKWIAVGNPASVQDASSLDISVDSTGTPHVIYMSVSNGLVIAKYDGTQWTNVGDLTARTAGASNGQIAFYEGTPEIVYKASTAGTMSGLYVQSRGGWLVNQISFSVHRTDEQQLVSAQKISATYAAFRDTDPSENNKLNVMTKATGGNWTLLAPESLSTDISHISLAIDNKGNPYVAYIQNESRKNGSAYVVKSSIAGTPWAIVGQAISVGTAQALNLALDASDAPYLAFSPDNRQAWVKKFDGNTWVDYGSPIAKDNIMSETHLTTSPTGQLYLSYTHCVDTSSCAITVLSNQQSSR